MKKSCITWLAMLVLSSCFVVQTYARTDWNAIFVTTNATYTLNQSVDLHGPITVSNCTLTIANGHTNNVEFKAVTSMPAMFIVLQGGRLVVKGTSTSRKIIIDGGADFGVTNDGYLNTNQHAAVTMQGVKPSGGGAIHVNNGVEYNGLELQYVTMRNIRCLKKLKAEDPEEPTTGGAIYIGGSTTNKVIIDHCNITKSYAGNGSAFMTGSRQSGPVEVTDTVFMQNWAAADLITDGIPDKSGGTFRSLGLSDMNLVFRRCTFTRNHSCGGGGAIYYNSANAAEPKAGGIQMEVYGCSFISNRCETMGGAISLQANGMFDFDEETKRENLFFANVSGDTGGALAARGYGSKVVFMRKRDFIFDINGSVHMHGNRAKNGGAIALYLPQQMSLERESSLGLIINGARIYDNMATQNGGGLYFENLSEKTYAGEGEMDKPDDERKLVDCNYDIYLTLKSGIISNNTALVSGGGIFSRNVAVSDQDRHGSVEEPGSGVSVTDNRATLGGGGLYLARSKNSYTNCIEFSRETFIRGNQASDGGGVYVTNGLFIATAGHIEKNVATNRGGGICLGVDGHATFDGTVDVSHNVATNLGGGVVMNNNSTLTINNGTFSYNLAQMGGGAHLLGGATLTINGGNFFCNRAVYREGTDRVHVGSTGTTTPTNWPTAWHTERYDLCSGVGGGIYLGAGLDETHVTTLNCPKSDRTGLVGAYSNVADRAGNEIVSAGVWTKVTLPNRVLEDGEGRILHWFEDYYTEDTHYAERWENAPEGTAVGMRYLDAAARGMQQRVWEATAQTGSPYLCLTLGYAVDMPVKALWITDHVDAGDGMVHLAFQPIFENTVDMAIWIPYARTNNLVRYVAADTEAELASAPLKDDFTFRDGTGDQDAAKGWCWITVPGASTNKLYKVVICDYDPIGGVQLWENGLIWDTKNVGATSPEDAGYVFWWGDTVGYTRVNDTVWAAVNGGPNIRFGEDYDIKVKKTWKLTEAQLLAGGWIDDTGNLTTEHDAAMKHLGAPWRLPTKAEAQELLNRCTVVPVTKEKKVVGYLVTGKETGYTDKSIYFPCSGRATSSGWDYRDRGYYWTSTPNNVDENSEKAWEMYFTSSEWKMSWGSRTFGLRVRGVREYVRRVK